MEHSHPIPEPRTDLCPNCKCCGELAAIREKRREKDRRAYQRNPARIRAKALRSYHNRKIRPQGHQKPVEAPK